MSPTYVIKREQTRLPFALAGDQAMIDHDFPSCQMMAEEEGAVIWYLDGCNFGDEFLVFFYHIREEREEEQRQWHEFNRKFGNEQQQQDAARATEATSPTNEGGAASTSGWRQSLSEFGNLRHTIEPVLFGPGAHLAELTADQKESPRNEMLGSTLNRHFGDLREELASHTLVGRAGRATILSSAGFSRRKAIGSDGAMDEARKPTGTICQ